MELDKQFKLGPKNFNTMKAIIKKNNRPGLSLENEDKEYILKNYKTLF